MEKPRKKKRPDEYRFKIDAYSPETMPLSVLANYLHDLAEMLGEDKSTHLIRIEDGCTCPIMLIDREAQPKIEKRVREIESGDAPPKAMEAFHRISRRLREDNAESGAIIGPTGDNLIIFPVREEASPGYGPFKQPGAIDGVPVMVGGTKEQVSIHLEGRDRKKYVCYASRSLAKKIATHLFTTVIRVEGEGRWIRHPEGEWEMTYFKIADFHPLGDESDISLKKSIEELRAIPAKWKELDDPVAELLRIRHGANEPIAELTFNGHSSEG